MWIFVGENELGFMLDVWLLLIVFGFIVIGGLGSLLVGIFVDCIGRIMVIIVSLVVSGSCVFLIGFFYGVYLLFVVLFIVVWGFLVVVDLV